jgi:hypothetical protein
MHCITTRKRVRRPMGVGGPRARLCSVSHPSEFSSSSGTILHSKRQCTHMYANSGVKTLRCLSNHCAKCPRQITTRRQQEDSTHAPRTQSSRGGMSRTKCCVRKQGPLRCMHRRRAPRLFRVSHVCALAANGDGGSTRLGALGGVHSDELILRLHLRRAFLFCGFVANHANHRLARAVKIGVV